MKRALALALLLLAACKGEERPIVVGSKNFTESVILGELLAGNAPDRRAAARPALRVEGG